MIFPVPIVAGVRPEVSDHFGFSPVRGRNHQGADIMFRRKVCGSESLPTQSKCYEMPNDVPALAFDDGVVTKASVIRTGGRVEIDHGDRKTKYFHLRNMRVKEGDRVKAGQPVGTISFNPSSYKLNHLHFEIHRGGDAVNPEPEVFRGQMVAKPLEFPFIKIGIAAGVGYLLYRYVFT